jgi:hypothetical protein
VRKPVDINFIIAILLAILTGEPASNTIGPRLTFSAEPSAKVCAVERLYVYFSLDGKPDHYCPNSNVVLSTDDMKTRINLFMSFS